MEAKKERRKKNTKIGGVLITAFLLLYVPSLIHWIYGNQVGTQLIRMGSIEDSISTVGIILRNEEILKSSFSGKCILEVNEGEKVPAGYRIATVLKPSASNLLEELRKKDNAILKNQIEINKNKELFSEDLAKLESEISQKLINITVEIENKNLTRVKVLKDEINTLIKKKAEIYGGTSTADTYINSLKSEKDRIQEQINQNKKEIITNSPGIISFNLDGYESKLKPEEINNLTPKIFDEINEKDNALASGSKDIETEKPFAKLIKDIDAYIIIALDKQKGDRFMVDDTIDEIRINTVGYAVNGNVYYKSALEDGKYIIALQVNKGISETSSLRKIDVELVKNSYKGLKVHLNSLKDIDLKNMTAKICLVKYNYSKFVNVKITGYNEDFAIISSLDVNSGNGISLYDTYILEPKNIQEGQMINK